MDTVVYEHFGLKSCLVESTVEQGIGLSQTLESPST